MEIIKIIALYLVAWIVGILIGSFTIGNLVLVSGYGIPLAVRLKNKGLFSTYSPVTRYVIGLLVNSVLLSIVVLAVMQFLPNLFLPFLFGLGMVVIRLGTESTRYNDDNLKDFLAVNARHFEKDVSDLSETQLQDLFDLRGTRDIEGNQLFARVFGELVSNSLSYAVWVLGIILIGYLSWWLGIIMAGIFTIIVALSFIQTAFVTVISVIGWPALFFTRKAEGGITLSEQFWLSASTILRIVELAIDLLFLWILYTNFFVNYPI